MGEFWNTVLSHAQTVLLLPFCLLTVLIIHELGHYAAARALGLRVEHVVFGRGRILWTGQGPSGTRWTLHLWPLRAHVQIADFDGNQAMPWYKKLCIILAGPLSNLLLPLVLFFAYFLCIGKPATPTVVSAVDIGMPAYEAGMRPGDKVLSVDGQDVQSMEDIMEHTRPRRETPVTVRYDRGGATHTALMMPVWAEYRDLEGVWRSHGRIGLSTWQQAYDLKVVRSVDGVPTPTLDSARTALLERMGQRAAIGLKAMDGKIYTSLVDLYASSNPHLSNPDHKEYKRIFMGSRRDNIYLPLTLTQSAQDAAAQTGRMVAHAALLPFNLFPIDKEWITPDAVVSGETSLLRSRLYVFVFFTSLCSCFIGLLNLLPFPRLDGGALLVLAGEGWKRRTLTNKEKAAVLVFGLLLLYAGLFGANMGDLKNYYLFQMQKASAAE